jgi:regulator of chromosome condensation
MAKSTPATATKTATGATKRESEDGRAKQPSKKTKPTPAPARRTTKRKSDDEDEDNQRPVKKARSAAPRPPPQKVAINQAPSQKLDVYVFGEGANGELGLGGDGNVVDVKRPRLNPNLSAEDVGVVQIACGGMHVAALTHDNKILTWGVNDQKCLGRDTSSRDEEDEGDTGINNREATPTAVDIDCPEGTVFTQVAAGDSITVALTDEGLVYGCGTFRVSLLRSILLSNQQLTRYLLERRRDHGLQSQGLGPR